MKKTAKQSLPDILARLNPHGLTLTQQNAVDLLAAGKNDTETAGTLGVNRVTITRWRLYSPQFRAALATQRAAIWGASADRLRALLPKAVDVLADALDIADDKVTVALAVLKLAGPPVLAPSDLTDSEDIIRATVERERETIRSQDRLLDSCFDNLPGYAEHMETVRKRLALMAGPDEVSVNDLPTFPPSEANG